MRLISLISLFAMGRCTSTGLIGIQCPIGYVKLGNNCVAIDDDDDGWLNKPERVWESECNCTPFYQCRIPNVGGFKYSTKCTEPVEVCCAKGASETPCGWGLVGTQGSDEAHRGEFPWMVAILNPTTKENWTQHQYIGGGSIIHPRIVLTVAHKVAGNNPMMCRAGQWSRRTPDPNVTQDRLVHRAIIHPAYDRQYLANDIALLKLAKEFDVSRPMVQPVCLSIEPAGGTQCFAMGWGRRHYNSNLNVDKLKKIVTPLVSREVCWRALQAVDDARRKAKGLELIERLELHSSLICAGGLEGQDTCVGDGGSPLVCQLQSNASHSRWAVFGLAAWGAGCGAAGAPGVYVDVAQFRAWIMGIVAP